MDELQNLYQSKYNVRFISRLGEGKDGCVFMTTDRTAVKFVYDRDNYNRELRAYRLLQSQDIVKIVEHNVPSLIQSDDGCRAIEMSVVRPPFVVDFASSYTDDEIEWLAFSDDVMAERENFWADRFGDDWPAVIRIREEFHALTGLTLLDLSQNNIRFI